MKTLKQHRSHGAEQAEIKPEQVDMNKVRIIENGKCILIKIFQDRKKYRLDMVKK